MSNSRAASGDRLAASLVGMSSVPESSTGLPGRNFSVAGLGVTSVWMNISGFHCGFKARGWLGLYPIDGLCARGGQPLQMRGLSSHSIDIGVAEIAGDDRHRYRKLARVLGEVG